MKEISFKESLKTIREHYCSIEDDLEKLDRKNLMSTNMRARKKMVEIRRIHEGMELHLKVMRQERRKKPKRPIKNSNLVQYLSKNTRVPSVSGAKKAINKKKQNK